MDEIEQIEVVHIRMGENEQRIDYENEGIEDLARSIQRLGMLNPIMVRDKGDYYEIIAGHRRYLAARTLNLTQVPAIIKDSEFHQDKEVTFAENYYRKDLSPVELAGAIKDMYVSGKSRIDEIARCFNKSEDWVKRQIAICDWPEDILGALHNGKINISAGNNLAFVTDRDYRVFLLRNAIEQGATARTTAAWLQAWQAMQPAEQAIEAEPVPGKAAQQPIAPQAPCLFCGEILPVNMMSHVPLCGHCIQFLRTDGQEIIRAMKGT